MINMFSPAGVSDGAVAGIVLGVIVVVAVGVVAVVLWRSEISSLPLIRVLFPLLV